MAAKCEYQLIKSDFIPSRKWRLAYFRLKIIYYLLFIKLITKKSLHMCTVTIKLLLFD